MSHLRWLPLVALLTFLPARDDNKRVEEEDDTFKPGKPVLRVEEPDAAERSARLFPRPAADLRLAVRDTKSAYLHRIYRDLEVAHDVVIFTDDRPKEDVLPLDRNIADQPQTIRGTLELLPFGADWKPGKGRRQVSAAAIVRVNCYEQLVREAAAAVRSNEKDLLRHERLAAAEQLLSVALTFHETHRRGADWKDVGTELRQDLLNVLLGQVRETSEAKAWDEAADLAHRLTTTYATEIDQVRIAAALGDVLLKALNEPSSKTARLREVRQQVRRILDQFAANPTAKEVVANLHQQADTLLVRANKAVEEKKLPEAEDLLQQATELNPSSQELRDLRTKLNQFYPVLRVGVRALPQFFSPARATTDAELRAVELLFEGLVKVVPGADGAARYRPGLAVSLPHAVPLGREFVLPRNVTWAGDKSDQAEKPVTAIDVGSTVTRLKEGADGRRHGSSDLLRDVEIGNPYRVTLSLTRGCLDPLALMTFKIIPDGVKADDENFALKPIGSGPYRLGTRGNDAVGDYVAFTSNPGYASRPGRTGLPHIREIRFYASPNPVQDVKADRLQLALDLSATDAAALAKDSSVLVPPPGPNRRVYFLAVHHQPGSVLSNRDFRRCLALAINREELLDEHFRKGLGKSVHKALNGPFPAGSWACKPSASDSLDIYDPKLAESLAAMNAAPVTLKLKYPTGDPQLERALKDLCKQVRNVTKNVTLELVPLSPYELRKAVEDKNYELAYWHYDFPDETYSLAPLLGQDGNDMNYRGADLQARIQHAAVRREFDKVREQVRVMQGILETEMPLIPLWQLDPLSAYREELKPAFYDRSMGPRKEVEKVPYDPLLVFTDVENWRLERK